MICLCAFSVLPTSVLTICSAIAIEATKTIGGILMMARRLSLALVILTCVFSVGGQQPPKPPTVKLSHLDQNDRLTSLASNVNDLDNRLTQVGEILKELNNRLTPLETHGAEEIGRYQIAATTIENVAGTGVSFAQVFIVDTRTGHVCQVVGAKVANGELAGTSLPYCTQQ
jgi:hypothetical protein